MILQVYAIYDEKAKTYINVFYRGHNGEAIRSFGDDVQNQQSTYSKHPSDYSLYKLATFSTDEGSFASLKQPEFVSKGSDFVEAVPSVV